MSSQHGDITRELARLQDLPAEEQERLLESLRRSDEDLHGAVLAEFRIMQKARDAMPTPPVRAPSEPHGRDVFVGQRVGEYTLEERLGIGGMGVVYRARRTDPFEQTVAIKLLHPLLATDDFRRRFIVEQQALASLDHPSIASIIDAGEHAGTPFLVMELVEGVAADRYATEANATITQRLRLIELVAIGIQHAHDRGVIHRDLKPSNILVKLIDGGVAVKIIDFGIARLLGDEPAVARRPTIPVGTPVFASPEQRNPTNALATVRSDVFGLGATLRALLEACPAESGGPPQKDIDAVIASATAHDPRDRYASAADFAEDLRRLQVGREVAVRRIGPAARSKRWVSRHPGRAGLVAAVAVLSFAAVWAGTQAAFRGAQRRAATEAFEQTQRYYLGGLLGLAHSRELGSNTRLRSLIERLTEERHAAFTNIRDPRLRASADAGLALGLATLWIDLEVPAAAMGLLAESEEAARSAGLFEGDFRTDVLIRRTDAARRLPDLETAIASGEEAVRLAGIEHGQGSRRVAEAGTFLGLAYIDAQQWGPARDVLERSLKIERQRLGPDDINTVRTEGNVAFLSMRSGDPIDAVSRYRAIVERLEGSGYAESVDMHLFKRQLGSLYAELERFEDAEPLLRDAITGMIAMHGEGHPEVIRPTTRLADVIAGLGRPEEALPLYEIAVQAAQAGTLNWLAGAEAVRSKAQTLTQLGRQTEAIATLADGIERVRGSLGDEHSALIGLVGQLAKAYRTTGRHDRAIPLYREALDRSLVFADGQSTNGRVMTNRNNLANGLLAAGQAEQAAEQFRRLAEAAALAQPDTLVHGWAMRGHGRSLSAAARFEEAEAALLDAVYELGRTQGRNHPRTARAIESLLDNYGKWQESGPLPREARLSHDAWRGVANSAIPWPERAAH